MFHLTHSERRVITAAICVITRDDRWIFNVNIAADGADYCAWKTSEQRGPESSARARLLQACCYIKERHQEHACQGRRPTFGSF